MRKYKPYRRPYKYLALLKKIEERNETQLEISQMLGITELSFRKKLDGKTEWKINEIKMLCEHFKTGFNKLFKTED